MRDHNRIKVILNLLEQIWKENPDLRLGQIISNAVPSPGVMNDYELYLFNYEDDKLIEDLKKMVKADD